MDATPLRIFYTPAKRHGVAGLRYGSHLQTKDFQLIADRKLLLKNAVIDDEAKRMHDFALKQLRTRRKRRWKPKKSASAPKVRRTRKKRTASTKAPRPKPIRKKRVRE